MRTPSMVSPRTSASRILHLAQAHVGGFAPRRFARGPRAEGPRRSTGSPARRRRYPDLLQRGVGDPTARQRHVVEPGAGKVHVAELHGAQPDMSEAKAWHGDSRADGAVNASPTDGGSDYCASRRRAAGGVLRAPGRPAARQRRSARRLRVSEGQLSRFLGLSWATMHPAVRPSSRTCSPVRPSGARGHQRAVQRAARAGPALHCRHGPGEPQEGRAGPRRAGRRGCNTTSSPCRSPFRRRPSPRWSTTTASGSPRPRGCRPSTWIRPRARLRAAEELGLTALLRSQSLVAFAPPVRAAAAPRGRNAGALLPPGRLRRPA